MIEDTTKSSGLDAMIARLPAAVFRIHLPSGNVERVEGAIEAITGRTADAWFGTPFWLCEIAAERSRIALRADWDRIVEGRPSKEITYEILHADGSTRWVLQQHAVVRDDDGRAIALEGVMLDVTNSLTIAQSDNMRALEALVTSEAQYRAIANHLPNGMVALFDHDLRYTVSSGAGLAEIGMKPDDLVGKRLRDIFPPEIYERDEPALKAALRGETTESIVTFGDEHFRVVTLPVNDTNGNVIQGMVLSQNITQLKETDRRLQAALDELQLAVETAKVGVWRLDLASGAVEWNDRLFEIYGVDPAAFDGALENWQTRVHPEDLENAEEELAKVNLGESVDDVYFRIVRPNGEVRHLVASAAPEVGPDGSIVRIVGINIDITPLKQSEERLSASERRYRSLFESTLDAIFVTDGDGRIVDSNPAAARLVGLEIAQLCELRFWELVDHAEQDAAKELWRRLRRDGTLAGELTVCREGGEMREVVFRATGGVPDLDFFVMRDITDQRRAEAARARLDEGYRQAQKLEALGQLTGGVAHDFNNLLQVIMAQSFEALEILPKDSEVREMLDDVMRASERAGRLVTQLLAFSRQQMIRPRTLDLTEVVESMLTMLRPLIGTHIELTWKPSSEPALVHADDGMVEQVVMNLCLNARDAMPDGGRLDLATRLEEVDAERAASAAIRPGAFVQLEVSDTGLGMSGEVLGRAFDPFYTTKKLGKGTGLGLATVYGIITQHGGHIDVRSEPGAGTTFTLLWPCADAAVPAAVVDAPAESTTTPMPHETILLAEDEDIVRRVTTTFLERAGYRVVAVQNGAEAVAAIEDRGDEIHLAVLDLIMPKMTGKAAYEKIHELRPQLPVIFVSGFSEHADELVEQGLRLLPKPFRREALLDAVRTELDARR